MLTRQWSFLTQLSEYFAMGKPCFACNNWVVALTDRWSSTITRACARNWIVALVCLAVVKVHVYDTSHDTSYDTSFVYGGAGEQLVQAALPFIRGSVVAQMAAAVLLVPHVIRAITALQDALIGV